MFHQHLIANLITCFFMAATPIAAIAKTNSISVSEAREIAAEAYVYLYPLITMEVSRLQLTNIQSGKIPGRGPANMFHHMRAYPDANFRVVVRPNFDTLYSSAWLDLRKEPMVIRMPATNGRYYLLPLMDMWTDVLAAPGSRTTSTEEQVYAVLPPNWKGNLPKGVQPIQSTTSFLWLIGRIQTNGAADYPAVHKIQDQMSITPLSAWGKKPVPPQPIPIDPNVDMTTPALDIVNGMSGEEFFTLGSKLLKSTPSHLTDWSQLARMKKIGVSHDGPFDSSVLSQEVRDALNEGAKDGLKMMYEKLPTLAIVANGWSMNTNTMGVYGNYYLKRAIVSMVGLGANQPEDAVYPLALADHKGDKFSGDREYILHFDASELPPNSAFWSLTMYDAQGFQVANELNRFAIGDRDKLKYNSDGSLDLYIQHKNPGPDKESNWLPSPATGELGLTMRIYSPKPQVLDGRWVPPAIKRQ